VRVLALALVVVGCTLAGCGAAGTPAPPSDVAPPTTSAVTPKLAPRVPSPRDARRVAACDLLTDAQKQAAGADLTSETPLTQGAATRCRWHTADGNGSLLVTSGVDFPVGGLEGLYLVRSTYSVFEPGELDGFPIVRAEPTDTGDEECTLYIGIADDQLIWATAGFSFTDRSACVTARRMGSDMIANLPALG
jgi:hypothetical protein